MLKFIYALIRGVVSLPALLLFTLHTSLTCIRFAVYCFDVIRGVHVFKELEFVDFHDVIAVRMIAMGVLMLERHDILEYTKQIAKHSEYDAVTETSNPYGAYYLCFGLILESVVMALQMPNRVMRGPVADETIVFIAFIVSAFSAVVSAHLAWSYIRLLFGSKKSA